MNGPEVSQIESENPINAKLHDTFWLSYVQKSQLYAMIDECQAFFNGDQWPEHGDDNFPRPVLNVLSYSATLKSSKICGTPIYFAISASNEGTDCSALRRFDEYILRKLHSKDFNFQSCLNGYVNGTEIIYYRWDLDNESMRGIYKGGLAEEHIDPHCFAVANPHLQSIQKQKWVMFWTDVEVSAAKSMVEKEGFKAEEKKDKKLLIERETNIHYDETNKDKDIINHSFVRVYTRFFRIKGEVFYQCSTDKVNLFKYPHALSPLVNAEIAKKAVDKYNEIVNKGTDEDGSIIADLDIDSEDVAIGDSPSELQTTEGHQKVREKFNLYPFEIFSPKSINNSVFGRSDVWGNIAMQKSINFNLAMVMQCAQNNAFNKMFAKEEALQGQKITNEPGQLLIDHSKFTNGWGIKFAESQPMPNDLITFTGTLLSFMSKYGGFDNISADKMTNNGVSGYAIQQMIKENNTPIEQEQQKFWDFQERCFEIRLLFYKFYIDQAFYSYDLTDGEVQEQELARTKLLAGAGQNLPNMITGQPFTPQEKQLLMVPTRKTQIRSISKNNIFGVDFDISVDVEQGLADSKLTEEQFWDSLILNGGINNLTPDMLDLYIQGSPIVPPQTKAELRRLISNLKQSEASQLKSQLQQAEQVIEQLTQYSKSLEARLGMQSVYIDNLTKEFSEKINSANKVLSYQTQAMAQAQRGAVSPGEAKSNNARGVDGSKMQQETPVQQMAQ